MKINRSLSILPFFWLFIASFSPLLVASENRVSFITHPIPFLEEVDAQEYKTLITLKRCHCTFDYPKVFENLKNGYQCPMCSNCIFNDILTGLSFYESIPEAVAAIEEIDGKKLTDEDRKNIIATYAETLYELEDSFPYSNTRYTDKEKKNLFNKGGLYGQEIAKSLRIIRQREDQEKLQKLKNQQGDLCDACFKCLCCVQ